MKTRQLTTNHSQRDAHQHSLRRGLGFWELTFEGRHAIFKHEQGALYVACLLLDPPSEPVHAVALALKAKEMGGQAPGPAEVIQQRSMGLDDAASVRALWRRQRALEAVLEDEQESEPVKAEALRELEEVTEFLRKSPWRSRGGAVRPGGGDGYPALPQPSGRGRGGSGRAASGLAGLWAASARAPDDALGPGWRS